MASHPEVAAEIRASVRQSLHGRHAVLQSVVSHVELREHQSHHEVRTVPSGGECAFAPGPRSWLERPPAVGKHTEEAKKAQKHFALKARLVER